MREIKFRAWDKTESQWIEINKMGFLENGEAWYVEDYEKNEPPYFTDRDDWVLMQFTGLKDKNGREIFERDIIRYTKHIYTDCSRTEIEEVSEPIIGVFEFIQGVYPSLKLENGHHHIFMFYHLLDCESDFEVIGNIYENPKLLEEQNNGL